MEYRLEDLIDFTKLEKLLDDLPEGYALPTSVIDLEHNNLLEWKFQDICTKFHHTHPVCLQGCEISDQYILDHIHEARPSVTYHCPHGLIDNATPLIIDGKHMANVFVGQILEGEPDLEFFKAQAKRFGFDEEAYMQALARVPRVTPDQLDRYLAFIKRFSELLAETGLERLRVLETTRTLQESEERFRTIFNSVNDSVIIQDLTTGAILDVNQKACDEFGYTREEFRQLEFGAIGSGEVPYTQQDALAWTGKAKAGEPQSFEWHAKNKAGQLFWVEVAIRRASIGGRESLVMVARNITERKLADEELKKHRDHLEELVVERTAELSIAKEQAQEADRLKSAFLATMSHELRTPLNSIIGFTGIILQGLVGPLNDEQAKQLGMVQGSAHHLLNLINDVLDISKIEAGQVEIVSEPFDMREAIEKVVRTVTPLAEKKGLALVAEVTPEVGRITSDRRRVEQILINLVNNAVKFTEEGEVRVECQVSDGWLVTRVVDTGIGIRPEDMGKLFEVFRQIDTRLARQHEGTGLGLSICKKLVGMLGGEIWAESEWGVGSTFTFTLPRREA